MTGPVLVTGGCGRVGRAAVRRLLAGGRAVRVFDRGDAARTHAELPDLAGATVATGDITDYAALLAAARGCVAIVHLAALPAPTCASADEVFRIDAAGTFNVFRAAEEAGIRRVVQASSINALGHFYGLRPHEAQWFPIDEDHPVAASDAYSFAKQVGEEIGDYHWRRSGISSVALRFPAVLNPAWSDWIAGWSGAPVERVLAMTDHQRRSWIAACRSEVDRLRAGGLMEDPDCWRHLYDPASTVSADARWFLGARMNLFAAVDDRDAAQAIQRGVDADYAGAHPLFIMQATNVAKVDAERLVAAFWPDAGRRRALAGAESLVSSRRAHDLIGYVPEHAY